VSRKSDLFIEGLAGAAAAVAVALLSDEAHAIRRNGRQGCEAAPDGKPRTKAGKIAEFIALHVAFRAVMQATRTLSRRFA
jgi:hypothetical protein